MLALADPADELADPRGGMADPDDLAGELERALAGLRPEYRLVFVLFHSQHLSYDEIALVVTRPVGTVKTWLHRARGPSWPNTSSTAGSTMNCRDFERTWNELIDAELIDRRRVPQVRGGPVRRHTLLAHAAACPTCRQERPDMRP